MGRAFGEGVAEAIRRPPPQPPLLPEQAQAVAIHAYVLEALGRAPVAAAQWAPDLVKVTAPSGKRASRTTITVRGAGLLGVAKVTVGGSDGRIVSRSPGLLSVEFADGAGAGPGTLQDFQGNQTPFNVLP